MDYFMLNKMAVCIMLMQRPGKPPFSKKNVNSLAWDFGLPVYARLDHVVADNTWRNMVVQASMVYKVTSFSHHHAIILNCGKEEEGGPRPAR